MHPKPSPAALAACRAALTQTTDAPDIAQIRHAWATLKAARGQPVQPARLGEAHHLIAPDASQHPCAPDLATSASVIDTTAQALPRTLACIRARGIIPLSDRRALDLDGAA